jgi:hypothetical protein
VLGHAVLLGAVTAALGPGAVPAPTVAGTTSAQVQVPLSAAALARVEQARLTGVARAYAEAERAEALDLALAAGLAGEVAATIAQVTVPEADGSLLEDLRAAQWELETAPRAGTPDADPTSGSLDEAAALEAAAQRVFAISLEIETGRQTVVDEQRLRAQHVTTLEQAAEAATSIAEPIALEAPVAEPVAFAGPVAPVGDGADDPWPNGRIPTSTLCAPRIAPGALLRCDAAEALDELSAAYRADHGSDLVVTSGYRSVDEQAALKRARGWLAAPPGRSNHGRGIAVDLAGMGGLGQFDAPGYRWMRQHAPAFGWHHPRAMQPGGSAPPEPWHWEFAGTTSEG